MPQTLGVFLKIKAIVINKKILQIIDFAGFIYFFGLFENFRFRNLRRVRDSNPRTCYSQQFSRLPQSTTLPTLPKLRFYRHFQWCKYKKFFNSDKIFSTHFLTKLNNWLKIKLIIFMKLSLTLEKFRTETKNAPL